MHSPKALNARLIKQSVKHPAIQDIHVFDTLESSNTWALQHAKCGDACLTEQQNAGRGRRGKVWHSPQHSNLYLSLKWCFDKTPLHIGLLSLAVGIVIAECLKKEGLQNHGLKWPNDIIWQGKKLGGILLETKGKPQHIVIGIGLNIAMPKSAQIDQPWANLNDALNSKIDRNTLSGRLLSSLALCLEGFQQLDIKQFMQAWKKWDLLQNQSVNILSANETLLGQAIGVNQQGMLKVCLEDGRQQTFLAADVSIRNR